MVKRVLRLSLLICLAILLFPNISSIDTTITVKTVPFGNVNLNILDSNSDGFSVIDRINKDATNYGDVVFVYSSDLSRFDLSIYVKRNEEKVFYERYDGIVAGQSKYIVAAPEGTQLFYAPGNQTNTTTSSPVSQTNITANLTTNTTNSANTSEAIPNTTLAQSDENSQKTPGITGMSTSEDSGKGGIFSNSFIYFIVGILVLGAIVLTGALRLRSISRRDYSDDGPKKEIKVKKLSERLVEMKEERKVNPEEYQKAIEDAELKIKEAQKEINKIKNSSKIDEIRKRMEYDKKELERLQKE